MTSETLMASAPTTTESAPASPPAATPATVAEPSAQPQTAIEGQPATQPEGEPSVFGAPEKYEFAAPEGKSYSAEAVEAFSALAKDLDLSQGAAQKMIDTLAPALAAKQAQAQEKARNDWAESSRSDKEFGGDKIDENIAVAKNALDQFGSPELRALLNESGLGNHPEFIRAFYRVGKAISEDRMVSGSGAPQGASSVAQRMYPNMNP